MKKTNALLFLISFHIILFVTACNQQYKKGEGKNLSPSGIVNTETPQNQSAEVLYKKLMSSFSNDWMEREADPDLYPDYYGGSFVNHNGTFVVTVNGNREEHKKRLAEILGTDNFNVETVQYSYKQMMRVMENIDAFLMNSAIPEDHPLMTRFAGAYPDVEANRVKVLLTETDNTTIRLFQKEITNSPLVIFEKGELPTMM